MNLVCSEDFSHLYARFSAAVTALDCGDRCGPHNVGGVPFCCDLSHTIPSAYPEEWDYLRGSTSLWHRWQPSDPDLEEEMARKVPPGHVLIACLGHRQCQREFRSITCRTFPFFPYFDLRKRFIGLAPYWEYEDRCWVISHLDQVSAEFRRQFTAAYEWLFEHYPDEIQAYIFQSIRMRRIFGRRRRSIVILPRGHEDEPFAYKVAPGSGDKRRVALSGLPAYGIYRLAARLPFPDER